MYNLINSAIAQETVQAVAKQPSPWTSMIPLVLIMAVFYFLLIRPQQKKIKDHQLLVKTIAKGDQVVTNGGIHGEVSQIDEEKSIVYVIIAESVTIKIRQDMISEIVKKDVISAAPVQVVTDNTKKLSKKSKRANKL